MARLFSLDWKLVGAEALKTRIRQASGLDMNHFNSHQNQVTLNSIYSPLPGKFLVSFFNIRLARSPADAQDPIRVKINGRQDLQGQDEEEDQHQGEAEPFHLHLFSCRESGQEPPWGQEETSAPVVGPPRSTTHPVRTREGKPLYFPPSCLFGDGLIPAAKKYCSSSF